MNTTHHSTHAIVLALSLVLAAALTGCGPTTAISPPAGYVELDENDLGYGVAQKALSPDGAILVVRERDNEPKGNLQFWSEALQRELTEGASYKLLEAEDVTAQGGYKGKVMRFKGTINEAIYRYDVAMFVTDELIVTVEAAAPEASYAQHQEAFEGAVRSLHPR